MLPFAYPRLASGVVSDRKCNLRGTSAGTQVLHCRYVIELMSFSTGRHLLGDICQAYNDDAHSIYRATCPQVWEDSKWRVRNNLQSETVGVRPSPFWESPACHLLWPVGRLRRLAERRRMCRRRTPRRIISSSSVKKRFPTSACRPSMCSTRKTPLRPNSARRPPGGVVAGAAAAAAAAVAAGEAAAVAAVAAAAAGP